MQTLALDKPARHRHDERGNDRGGDRNERAVASAAVNEAAVAIATSIAVHRGAVRAVPSVVITVATKRRSTISS